MGKLTRRLGARPYIVALILAALFMLTGCVGAPEALDAQVDAPAEAEPRAADTDTSPAGGESQAARPTEDDEEDDPADEGLEEAQQVAEFVPPIIGWQLRRGPAELILIGSIHVAPERMYPLPSPFVDALVVSERLVLEVDPTRVDPGELNAVVMEIGTMPPGESVIDYLDEEEEALVTKAFSEFGIPLGQIAAFRPYLLDTTLSSLVAQSLGFRQDLSVDLWFAGEAARRDIPVLELETAEEQLQILADLPMEVQIASLVETADAVISGQAETDLMNLEFHYTQGNVEGLAELIAPEEDAQAGLQMMLERLFRDRNYRWADYLEELVAREEGITLVVVGAGHLVGEDSLVEILADRGFEARWMRGSQVDLDVFDGEPVP